MNEIISSKKSILEGYTDMALLMGKDTLHIHIQDIKINVHSGTLGDERENFDYDSKTQLYSYKTMNDIPIEFKKEELLQYYMIKGKLLILFFFSLYKKRKVI